MTPAVLKGVMFAFLGVGVFDLAVLNTVHTERAAPNHPPNAAGRATVLTKVQGSPPRTAPAVTGEELEAVERASEAVVLQVADSAREKREDPTFSVFFENESPRVGTDAAAELRGALSSLRSAPSITLVGHSDASGPTDFNEALSRARALAVSRFLADQGVPIVRIRSDWRGSREPRGDGHDRRVDIYLGDTL